MISTFRWIITMNCTSRRAIFSLMIIFGTSMIAALIVGVMIIFDGGNHRLSSASPSAPRIKLPLKRGDILVAHAPFGMIEITATDNFTRVYKWNGCEQSATLGTGRSGKAVIDYIASPGDGDHWTACDGITRGVLEEGTKDFESKEEAIAWLRDMTKRWNRYLRRPISKEIYIYNNAGLVVGWSRFPPRRQLDVQVWQFLIDGHPPKALPGSEDDKIQIYRKSDERNSQDAT